MNRRAMLQTGILSLAYAAGSGWGLEFTPDAAPEGDFRNWVPFRKPPRKVREEAAGFLWADAADFQAYGGWALDTQHVGFMGSSYLIAHGTRSTVADATLVLSDVAAGRYRLWVRSRNWVPEHAPGRFGMLVNGTDSGRVYGSQRETGWTWQDGGVQTLAGVARLTLQDRTGLFGRCSTVLLTRDLDYQPPSELAAFQRERARLTGVSDAIQPGPEVDVVVVGAGTAGCCAAIAAARFGFRVALVSDRPVLGGNASVEIGVPVQGAGNHQRYAREGGVIEEAGRLGWSRGWGATMSRPFAALAEAEPTLQVFENQWLEGVAKDGSRIRSVICRHTLTGARQSLAGRMFIDTSGDAWLGHHAGADQRVGREAKAEFDEPDAPQTADGVTMSGCLRGPRPDYQHCIFFRTVRADEPQPFEPPPWLYDLPDAWLNLRGTGERLLASARSGNWWFEHPGEVDDLWDPEFARDELFRVVYSGWSYFKNRWSERRQLANFALDYVPYIVGKRESRRLLGDYVLNQNDCLTARGFEDAIGHTGWPLDIHAVDGIRSTTGPYMTDHRIPVGQIPYRCLYSRNVENLLMAGRTMSVTHLALGTTRVQGQTSLTGQAAGTAAALALHHGTTPRGVYQQHLNELQQTLLKHDQYIPGVRNEDPADLAHRAVVRASSVRTHTATDAAPPGASLEVGMHRAQMFRWEAGRELQSVRLYLESAVATEVRLHLREARDGDDLTATRDLATATQHLAAGTAAWVTFAVEATVATPFAYVFLEPCAPVRWRQDVGRHPKDYRLYGSPGSWTQVKGGSMALQLAPEVGVEDRWIPAKVVNGVTRPTEEGDNCWESAREEPLPQWLELQLAEPAQVGAVQCIFDTDLSVSLPSQRDPLPPVCVRDYTLECRVDGAWQPVARVRDNFQRLRRHRFAPCLADGVRLTVEATHGSPTARVYEVRIYAEETPLLRT